MALKLVVTSAFPGYPRGTIVTDPDTINAIRTGDYAGQVVLVSDTVIPPPDVPPSTPLPGGGVSQTDYLVLKGLYDSLAASDVQQQSALAALLSVNTSQTEALNTLGQQLYSLNSAVLVLAAKVDNPNTGPVLPPSLADDVLIATNAGVVIATDANVLLAGDIR